MDLISQFERVAKELTLKVRNDPNLMPLIVELQGLVSLLNTEAAENIPALTPLNPVIGNAGTFLEKIDQRANPIVMRGLGDTIIKMVKNGETYEQIAFELELTIYTVREFVGSYNNSSPKERVELRKDSIFNIAEQLENYLVRVTDSLEALKENPDISQRYMDSYLKGIKFAYEFAEKMREAQDRENFKMAVMEVLDTAAPGTRKLLEDALRRNRDNLNVFGKPR